MQLAFLYVKLLKQQNYENIQTYRRRGKSKDAKVQTIKKVGEILPYSTK